MKKLLRSDAMDQIVDSRVDTCMFDNLYLPDILKLGFTGFDNIPYQKKSRILLVIFS